MYRPSQGHGQQPQSHQTTGSSRIRRSEDPLAELARLIGQEDPFKEFDAPKTRRTAANGAGSAPAVVPERRTDRYTNGNGYKSANGYSNGHTNGQAKVAVQPRTNGLDAPRPASRYAQAAAPAARPQVSRNEERYPAQRSPQAPAQPAPQQRSNGYAPHGYEEAPRSAARPARADGNGYQAERVARARDPYADLEPHSPSRAPAAPEQRLRRPEPQPANRYVPEEAPRHARGRPQPAPYQDAYQRGYEKDYDPEYDDAAYLPEHADDIYEDVQRPRRGFGFWLVAAIVLASLIAVAFLGVFAYRTIFNSQPRAAIVTKSETPVKVEAKGAQQPATSQSNKPIQDRLGGAPNQTQIVPREEAPVDLTRQQPGQEVPQPLLQQKQTPPAQQQRGPQFTPPAQQQQQAPQNVDQQPKRVKSVPLRSDGPVQQQQGPQSQNNAPTQLAPTAQAQEPDTQAIPQNRVPANRNLASLGPTPSPQTSGNYVVQVASHKTPEEAESAWSSLRQQYASIFGGRNADIRKVDLGDRGTFYRAMVGPMSREQANALCQNLKTQGAGCIVQTR